MGQFFSSNSTNDAVGASASPTARHTTSKRTASAKKTKRSKTASVQSLKKQSSSKSQANRRSRTASGVSDMSPVQLVVRESSSEVDHDDDARSPSIKPKEKSVSVQSAEGSDDEEDDVATTSGVVGGIGKFLCSPHEVFSSIFSHKAKKNKRKEPRNASLSFTTPTKQVQQSESVSGSSSARSSSGDTLSSELRAHLPPTPKDNDTPIMGGGRVDNDADLESLTTTAKKVANSPSGAKVLLWATPAERLAKILNDEGDNIHHLLALEKKQATSLEDVEEMNPSFTQDTMLGIVNDIHAICTQYYMRQQTFHLAAALVMRVLANEKANNKKDAKVLNYTAVLIASKLEEEQLKYDTDDVARACKITHAAVCKRERLVSELLQFRLSLVTQGSLLETFYNIAKFNSKQQQWSALFADVATFYASLLLSYPSSQIAAASVLLASMLTAALEVRGVRKGARSKTPQSAKKKGGAAKKSAEDEEKEARKAEARAKHWPEELVKATGYTVQDLIPVAQEIAAVMEESIDECPGLWRRYSAAANGRLLKTAKNINWDECLTANGVSFFVV